ncbi:zf-HC2 domain-containing protein [Streptomyces tailanensis]|uniref:zf-HC2 domain-containing protein n=1 Tax=Streptomyces tailanensis TaxID=2569858 RepID=UPI001FEBECC8|nr:zf-HC2 domain-containing protein [Streptomyces tailanensis]
MGGGGGDGPVGPPRIPLPRSSVEDTGLPLPNAVPEPTPDPAPERPPAQTDPAEPRSAQASSPEQTPGRTDRPEPPSTQTSEPEAPPVEAGPPGVAAGPASVSDGSVVESGQGEGLAPAAAPSAPSSVPFMPLVLEHRVLKALLGAWALAVCSAEEALAVEEHLGTCGSCADEARRLREAVGLLHQPESLDLDPSLRTQVLDSCLGRRPPRIPVPRWAAPYDAEAARLDALLQDIGSADWHTPVRLRWFEGEGPVDRRTTVAGVIAHLLCVDGLVATALGLEDPLDQLEAVPDDRTPEARTEAYWKAAHFPPTRSIRGPWREQSHNIVRTTSFTGDDGTEAVSYGGFELPLRDAMLDRAFECWIHAEDIAEAVDYPYEAPSPRHLHGMIDLAARMLPAALADRRRTGLAAPPAGRHLVSAGAPGRSLRLEIEGSGGGEWLIPLDSPAAVGSAEHEVAHVTLDGVEFCRLAAGHVPPEDAAAGQVGDRAAIRDVLFAAASLSRM